LRCAFIFLGLNGFDTEKTFESLKELYDVRSSIIHGSEKRSKIKDNDKQELIVYARKCLISFYILLSSYDISTSTPKKNLKQTLLQEVDIAMIDSSRWEPLRKKINSAIKDLQISDIPFMKDDQDWKV
jgi:hypothetical protein